MNSFNLKNRPKIEPGFKAPEGYFENFSEQVLARIERDEKPVVSIFSKHRVTFLAIAALLVLAIMIPFLTKNASENQNIDEVSIESYLAYQTNISQYELISLLNESDIEALETDLQLDDATLESVLQENNNLENYLTE